jgi:hypothetical protein
MLQVIIGIVFVLLLFSLLASTIMEIISGTLALRGKNLLRAIENMLGDKTDDFVRHPFYKQLTTNTKRRAGAVGLPSYLKNSSFSGILLDLLNDENGEDWAAKINNMPEGQLKKLLLYLYRQSGGEMTAFKKKVEEWFDEVMDRSSGVYKRMSQLWLFLIGLGLGIVFNADVFTIYHNLSVNSALSDYIANSATTFLEKNPTLPYTPVPAPNPTPTTPVNDSLRVETAKLQMDKLLKEEFAAIKSPLGLGWSSVSWEQLNPMWWLFKIVGWLTTALAISLGAPFWFEALRKLVSMRSSSPAAAPKENNSGDGDKQKDKDDNALQFLLESKSRNVAAPPATTTTKADTPKRRGNAAG